MLFLRWWNSRSFQSSNSSSYASSYACTDSSANPPSYASTDAGAHTRTHTSLLSSWFICPVVMPLHARVRHASIQPTMQCHCPRTRVRANMPCWILLSPQLNHTKATPTQLCARWQFVCVYAGILQESHHGPLVLPGQCGCIGYWVVLRVHRRV